MTRRHHRSWPRALVVIAAVAPVAAVTLPDAARRAASAPDAAPGLARFRDGGDPAALRDAIRDTRAAVARAGRRKGSSVTAALRDLDLLGRLVASSDRALGPLLARHFVVAREAPVFVTGYHEPTLAARRTPDERFRHPLYRPPDPPASGGRGSPTRRQIDAGALAGRGLELFWTDDPIELFFLHVQGSGRLELAGGSVLRVGYAASNGHRYRSIGAVLVARGVFSPAEATAPAIKAWLRAHPGEMRALLETNPRYVFFRVLDAGPDEGPPGALGAPLVAYRSVAVDPAAVPLGSVGVLETPLPDGHPLETLVIAMDTGAAIRGAGRLDLFTGSDRGAARIAGELRASGRVRWLRARP